MGNRRASIILLCLAILAPTGVLAMDTVGELAGYMQYLAERDKVLSRNVSNSDTPGYKPLDLTEYSRQEESGIRLATTNPGHIALNGSSGYAIKREKVIELKPNGNAVDLETELYKKGQNAVKLQEVANLYAKTKSMVKTATVGHK